MSNKDLTRELIGSPGDDDNADDENDDDDEQGYLEIMERMEMVILTRQAEMGTLLSLEAPCNDHFHLIII